MATRKAKLPTTPAEVEALINKEFGASTLLKGSDKSLRIERVPTGVLSIDILLRGGFARGRHAEIYGGYSTGKTSLYYRLIANAQSMGLNCAFMDAEATFDPKFAASQGVDLDKLSIQPRQEYGEQTINMIEVMLRSRVYDVIIVDSISALLPKVERETSMDKGTYGTQQAKMMSVALRRLTAANSRTVLGYINQQRESVGSMFQKWTTSGGRAMSFYAGTRMDMTKIETIKQERAGINPKTGKAATKKVAVGHRVLVRLDKDKTGARPNSDTTFVYDYRLGRIDEVEDLMFLGRHYGLIAVASSGNGWWVKGFEDEKQVGRNRFKSWLRGNPAIGDELREQIWASAEEDWANDITVNDDKEEDDDE